MVDQTGYGGRPADVEELLGVIAARIAAAPMNLVSRRDRERVASLHVPESRCVAQALNIAPGRSLLDLGSGGGLPGLVVAALRGDVEVVCLDATAKKMRFVDELSRELGLSNLATVTGRAEVIARRSEHRGRYDHVVSRAVSRVPVVAELGRGFLRPGGRLSVVKSERYTDELPGLRAVRKRLGYGAVHVTEVDGAPRPTWLVEARAVGAPPLRVPRGNGVPQAEPLGGP